MKGNQDIDSLHNHNMGNHGLEDAKVGPDPFKKIPLDYKEKSLKSNEAFKVYKSLRDLLSRFEKNKRMSSVQMNCLENKYKDNSDALKKYSRNESKKNLKISNIMSNSNSNILNYLQLVTKNSVSVAYINPNLNKMDKMISSNIFNNIIISKSEINKSVENLIEEKNTIDNTPENESKGFQTNDKLQQKCFSNAFCNNKLIYNSTFFGDRWLKNQLPPMIYGKKIDNAKKAKPYMPAQDSQLKNTKSLWRRNQSINAVGSIFQIDSNKLNKITRKYIIDPLKRVELKIPMTKTIPLPSEFEIENPRSSFEKYYQEKIKQKEIHEFKKESNSRTKKNILIPRLKLELIKSEY